MVLQLVTSFSGVPYSVTQLTMASFSVASFLKKRRFCHELKNRVQETVPCNSALLETRRAIRAWHPAEVLIQVGSQRRLHLRKRRMLLLLFLFVLYVLPISGTCDQDETVPLGKSRPKTALMG